MTRRSHLRLEIENKTCGFNFEKILAVKIGKLPPFLHFDVSILPDKLQKWF